MDTKKHILLTGGAGYIGSHTCKAPAKAGYSPVGHAPDASASDRFSKYGRFYFNAITTCRLVLSMIFLLDIHPSLCKTTSV